MSFAVANEYVIAFLTSQVESGVIDSSILDTWKAQEDEFKTLLGKKEKKDKNAPKGAKSAYILFCSDERPKVKEEEPGMDAKKIASELGKRWKELKEDDEDKVKEYQKKAEEDKVRFKTEMENYVPGEVEETKDKKIRKKDKNAPKGAKSAYIIFCTEERPQVKEDIPDISAKEVLTELGKRWKALKDEDKIKYQEMADEDKVRFKAEMENYVPGEVEDIKEKTRKKKDKNAPKGARSAYILFCSDERSQVKEDIPDINAKDVLVELGKRWRALKDDDEDSFIIWHEYQVMAEEDKVRFKKEMEAYVPEENDEEPKKKAKTIKEGPKRSKTAYQLFCEEQKDEVKQEGFKGKDVIVELARRWKELESEDKEYFNELKSRAEILKKEFQEPHPLEEKEKKIKKTEKEDKTEKKVKKTTATKAKVVKKKTNKDIVHEIMDSFDGDETITMRMIKKNLDAIEVVIDKNELKEIVNDYNNAE